MNEKAEVAVRKQVVGMFLKKAREDAALTQQQVAKTLSYGSAQFVSNWERGLALPPFDVFPRLVGMYKLEVRDMLAVLFKYQDEVLRLKRREIEKLFERRPTARARR